MSTPPSDGPPGSLVPVHRERQSALAENLHRHGVPRIALVLHQAEGAPSILASGDEVQPEPAVPAHLLRRSRCRAVADRRLISGRNGDASAIWAPASPTASHRRPATGSSRRHELPVGEMRAIGPPGLCGEHRAPAHHPRVHHRHDERREPAVQIRVPPDTLGVALAKELLAGQPRAGRRRRAGTGAPTAVPDRSRRAGPPSPAVPPLIPPRRPEGGHHLGAGGPAAPEVLHDEQRAQVARHRVEPAEGDDPRSVRGRLRVVPLDDVRHPRRLAGDVHVVRPVAHAGIDHRVPVRRERTRGGQHHPRPGDRRRRPSPVGCCPPRGSPPGGSVPRPRPAPPRAFRGAAPRAPSGVRAARAGRARPPSAGR